MCFCIVYLSLQSLLYVSRLFFPLVTGALPVALSVVTSAVDLESVTLSNKELSLF